jgi:hypothetical protein
VKAFEELDEAIWELTAAVEKGDNGGGVWDGEGAWRVVVVGDGVCVRFLHVLLPIMVYS